MALTNEELQQIKSLLLSSMWKCQLKEARDYINRHATIHL